MSCSYDADWGGYLDDYGDPCVPNENLSGGGGGSYGGGSGGGGYYGGGGGVPPNILVTPGGTQIPTSNLSNILNNIGSWLALLTHQSAVPTVLSQPGLGTRTNPTGYPVGVGTPIIASGGNLGGTVGSQLQKFISSPTGLLVIGAAVLLYMKPPGRR